MRIHIYNTATHRTDKILLELFYLYTIVCSDDQASDDQL